MAWNDNCCKQISQQDQCDIYGSADTRIWSLSQEGALSRVAWHFISDRRLRVVLDTTPDVQATN